MIRIKLLLPWQIYSKGHVFAVGGIGGMPAAQAESMVRGQMAEYLRADEKPVARRAGTVRPRRTGADLLGG